MGSRGLRQARRGAPQVPPPNSDFLSSPQLGAQRGQHLSLPRPPCGFYFPSLFLLPLDRLKIWNVWEAWRCLLHLLQSPGLSMEAGDLDQAGQEVPVCWPLQHPGLAVGGAEIKASKRPRPSLSAPAHGHTHLPRCHSSGKHPENPKTLSPLTWGTGGY